MSKVAIKGADTGTGVFTLESPATNTDRTLVLPDEAGTVLTTAGVPASAMPAGSVIQVVNARNNTALNTTSTSWVSTGTTASITPTSSSSTILVITNEDIHGDVDNDSQDVRGYYRLLRDSTTILENNNGTTSEIISRGGQQGMQSKSIVYEDNPATTNTITYKTEVKYASSSGSRNLRVNYDKLGTITLMEIAG